MVLGCLRSTSTPLGSMMPTSYDVVGHRPFVSFPCHSNIRIDLPKFFWLYQKAFPAFPMARAALCLFLLATANGNATVNNTDVNESKGEATNGTQKARAVVGCCAYFFLYTDVQRIWLHWRWKTARSKSRQALFASLRGASSTIRVINGAGEAIWIAHCCSLVARWMGRGLTGFEMGLGHYLSCHPLVAWDDAWNECGAAYWSRPVEVWYRANYPQDPL